MGTRADFYVSRGEDAEWLGSIAWDGYPSGVFTDKIGDDGCLPKVVVDEAHWRSEVEAWLKQRNDATFPEQGWPWPWDDSNTTDYAYTYDEGLVLGSCFGHQWFGVLEGEPDEEAEEEDEKYQTDGHFDYKKWEEAHPKMAAFPNMKERKNVTYGSRSGIMVVGSGGPVPAHVIDEEEAQE